MRLGPFSLSFNGTEQAAVPIATTGPLGSGTMTSAAALKESEEVSRFQELGVAGTPIISGFVQDLGEYRGDLYGRDGMRVYEQMRRGDAQVAATLAVLKLPVRSRAGDGRVEPASNSPIDVEIAKMVEDNLFGGLEFISKGGQKISQNWGDVVENLLLGLDFGCAAYEKVYRVAGDQIQIAKLAPRLPLTFYRFLTEDDGESLIALQQYGYGGNNFKNVDIPAWKLGLFTFQQEGANFFGRSVLRAAYKHWYYKEQLYAIDGIACERNGLGVPVIEHEPGGKGLSTEDKQIAFTFLTNLASHESAGAYMPPGVKLSLKGVMGQVRDCKESIRHHNEQISKCALAMFMDAGQAATGNRALGVSQQDFFFIAAQAFTNQVYFRINHSTVRDLVDLNYEGVGAVKSKSLPGGPAKRPSGYPTLVAPRVHYVSLSQVAEILGKLALDKVDVVHPDDEMEDALRDAMSLPERGKSRPRYAATVVRVSDDDPNAIADEAKTEVKASESPAGRTPRSGGILLLAEVEGVKVRRAPRGAELSLSLSDMVTTLGDGKGRVAAELRAAKPAIVAEALHKAMGAPTGRMHQVSVPADPRLVAAIARELRLVQQDGRRQVAAERGRQLAGKPPVNPKTGKLLAADAATGAVDAAADDDALQLYAQAAVVELTNNLTQRSVNRALDFKKNPGADTKGEALIQAQQDLEDAKDAWIDGLAAEATNEAYSDGRSHAFAEFADEIKSYAYSALLDIDTCEVCEGADGQEAAQEADLPDTPNPDCEGGDRCRCVIVATFRDEVESAA